MSTSAKNALRSAEATTKKKSPRVFSALPKIKFNAILLGFLKKWDNLSQKNWDKGVEVAAYQNRPKYAIISNISVGSKKPKEKGISNVYRMLDSFGVCPIFGIVFSVR